MKTYKKIFYVLAVLTLMLFLVACDGDLKSNANKSDNESADTMNEVRKDGKDGEKEMEETENKGVYLPEDYPLEFVPIMDDAISGSGLNTDNNFNIVYSTPSSMEQVIKFYTTYFQKYGDAVIVADNNLEINLEAEGRVAKILLDVTGTNTYVRISVHNAVNITENDVTNENNLEASFEMNKEFPTNIVPIIEGAEIIDQGSIEEENGTEYSITFSVDKLFKDVVGYYEIVVSEMSNTNIENGNYEFFATALKDNNSVEIQIMDNGGESTMVVINIYPE